MPGEQTLIQHRLAANSAAASNRPPVKYDPKYDEGPLTGSLREANAKQTINSLRSHGLGPDGKPITAPTVRGNFKRGGKVKETGKYLVHKGEVVAPKKARKTARSSGRR